MIDIVFIPKHACKSLTEPVSSFTDLFSLIRWNGENERWPEEQVPVYGAWMIGLQASIGYRRMSDEEKEDWERRREAMALRLGGYGSQG